MSVNLKKLSEELGLSISSVSKALRAFRMKDENATNRVWSLLAFQMWHQRWCA